MSAVIALLRAVNVGGRTVKAAQLRAVAEGLGHQQVATYVNSGNVVLVPAGGASASDVAAGLSHALAQECGFDVPVIARTTAEWDRVVGVLPFPAQAREDPSHLAVVCWDDVPDVASVREFDASRYGDEVVVWHGRETYAYYPHGQGRSRLTIDVLSRAAGRVGTARNWNTVLALQRLAHERDG
ncbi:DUF1697 domain-containing protein [Cellulomonas fimi]|uniref:DUF1697 domain-containing protein n=1 Tax=Cellulomonas fimi TaxID=1708 RepID=UPI0023590FDB|nr:DUF1697 domain-containing protein [Cellulomonas fimi]